MKVEEVIRANKKIVYAQLHRFNLIDDADALSYGLEALWRAAETFDESKGYAFSTYAYSCVYNGIAMYLRKRGESELSYDALVESRSSLLNIQPEKVKHDCDEILFIVKTHISEVKNKTHREILEYWLESGFEAKQAEIAEALGVSQAHVSRVINAFRAKYRKELLDDKQSCRDCR